MTVVGQKIVKVPLFYASPKQLETGKVIETVGIGDALWYINMVRMKFLILFRQLPGAIYGS